MKPSRTMFYRISGKFHDNSLDKLRSKQSVSQSVKSRDPLFKASSSCSTNFAGNSFLNMPKQWAKAAQVRCKGSFQGHGERH